MTPSTGATPQIIGNYQVLRLLGEGGMGQVFLAERLHIGGRVALKVLHANFANHPEMAARFFNEARAANSVEHAGIVKVYEYGRLPEGGAFIAMEFVNGCSLRQRITDVGKLATETAIRISRQMATALAAAHSSGVVHRDLKPDNVMLVPDSEAMGGERVKILDFGIAKILWDLQHQDSHTKTGTFMGTPAYMSPEQCRDTKSVGPKGDVYALGAILYEMLSGRPPFGPGNAMELAVRIVTEQPISLSNQEPSVPMGIAGLVDLLLAKDPDNRPTMTDVASRLRLFGESVSEAKSATPSAELRETLPLIRAIQVAELSDSSKTPIVALPEAKEAAPRPVTLTLEPPTKKRISESDLVATLGAVGIDSTATRPVQKLVAPSDVKSLPQQPAFALEPKQRGSRKPLRTILLLSFVPLLLGTAIIGGSIHRTSQLRKMGRERLAAIDESLRKEEWQQGLQMARALSSDTRQEAQVRQSARLQLERAQKEESAQRDFVKQRRLADSGGLDQALLVFSEIPPDSVYKSRGAVLQSEVIKSLANRETQAATEARERGACEEMTQHLQRLASIVPDHAMIKELSAAPCPVVQIPPDSAKADSPIGRTDSGLPLAPTAATPTPTPATTGEGAKSTKPLPAQQIASAMVRGSFGLAHHIAKQNAMVDPSFWFQAGEAACRMRNVQLAIEARDKLPQEKQQLLADRCLKVNVQLGVVVPGGKTIEPDKVLNEAYREYLNGNYAKSIALARPMIGMEPKRAWRIIGAAACGTKDTTLANQAFRGLDRIGRQFLVHACRSNGLDEQNGTFVPAD